MSHQESATLEKAGICRTIVNEAMERVRQAINECGALERGSSIILDDDSRRLIADMRDEARRMLDDLEGIRGSLPEYAFGADIDWVRSRVSETNKVYLRLKAVRSAVSDLYDTAMEEAARGNRLSSPIESIEEPEVRTMARLLARNPKHSNLPFEDLLELAWSRVDPSRTVRREFAAESIEDMRGMMEAGRVSEETIAEVTGGDGPVSPLAMMDAAVEEVMDESVRRAAVSAIVKSITPRGFIVRKSDIRHIREDNTVRITASKPGGQKAEFSIQLDGRFVYHFHGYEGQACQKDIGPMEKDLEEVYGFRMTDRNVLWSNPDRNQSMHYTEMKVRRDS